MTARSALWATLWAAGNTARARTPRLPVPNGLARGRLCAGAGPGGQSPGLSPLERFGGRSAAQTASARLWGFLWPSPAACLSPAYRSRPVLPCFTTLQRPWSALRALPVPAASGRLPVSLPAPRRAVGATPRGLIRGLQVTNAVEVSAGRGQAPGVACRSPVRSARLAISVEAFEAIARTLTLGSVGYEAEANERDERLIWMDHAGVSRLRATLGGDEAGVRRCWHSWISSYQAGVAFRAVSRSGRCARHSFRRSCPQHRLWRQR